MYYYLVLIILLDCVHSQNMGTLFTLSNMGMQFSLINPVQLLDTITSSSLIQCAFACIMFLSNCRTFQFDSSTLQCRLVEGDLTTGQIIPSTSSSKSIVGTMNLIPEMFTSYGQLCSQCDDNGLFTCINNTCQCSGHSYFDGFICKLQQFTGAECNSTNGCRADLNLTCLQSFQCGPFSLLIGITVAGYANGTLGTALNALNRPWGLALDANDSLYVADHDNYRVMKIQAGSLNGSIVAGTGVAGSSSTQLQIPAELALDANSNIYINDNYNYRVMLWRKNSSSGVIVAGNGTSGSTLSQLGQSVGLALDSHGNIYVSDTGNHRVMKWSPNATSGIVVAGTGVPGNSSQQLNYPYGLYLDENNSYLYIADENNNRIQRYSLNTTSNGTTVAGGNGAGPGNNQLNAPYGVYVSKQTGDIYITDFNNNRIQRWSPGATSGVTIVGITGVSGTNATLLNGPRNVLLSDNETVLYVSDTNNNRVQRYNLT